MATKHATVLWAGMQDKLNAVVQGCREEVAVAHELGFITMGERRALMGRLSSVGEIAAHEPFGGTQWVATAEGIEERTK